MWKQCRNQKSMMGSPSIFVCPHSFDLLSSLSYFHLCPTFTIVLFFTSGLLSLLSFFQFCSSFTFVLFSILCFFHLCPTYTFALLPLLCYFHFCPTLTFVPLSLLSYFHLWPTFPFHLFFVLTSFHFWPTFKFYLLSMPTFLWNHTLSKENYDLRYKAVISKLVISRSWLVVNLQIFKLMISDNWAQKLLVKLFLLESEDIRWTTRKPNMFRWVFRIIMCIHHV